MSLHYWLGQFDAFFCGITTFYADCSWRLLVLSSVFSSCFPPFDYISIGISLLVISSMALSICGAKKPTIPNTQPTPTLYVRFGGCPAVTATARSHAWSRGSARLIVPDATSAPHPTSRSLAGLVDGDQTRPRRGRARRESRIRAWRHRCGQSRWKGSGVADRGLGPGSGDKSSQHGAAEYRHRQPLEFHVPEAGRFGGFVHCL